jgi:hypothetical protein
MNCFIKILTFLLATHSLLLLLLESIKLSATEAVSSINGEHTKCIKNHEESYLVY